VQAALPLLRQAAHVAVLVAGDRPRTLPPSLQAAHVAAETVALPRGEGPIGATLLAAAEAEGADLLVMGAFAHGAWREAILGGVTRHVLAHAQLPVLLRH
jgi:nucleotide-binding universal stress UspA family protein